MHNRHRNPNKKTHKIASDHKPNHDSSLLQPEKTDRRAFVPDLCSVSQYDDQLFGARFSLDGVEREENGFEIDEGRDGGCVGGGRGVDAREVDAGEYGDEGKDDEAEVGVRGQALVVTIQPFTRQ
ncbi:hypothetical protein U1Q18_030606 [Sarracenia purpurea var. burkii]